jgi:hypothetical protein
VVSASRLAIVGADAILLNNARAEKLIEGFPEHLRLVPAKAQVAHASKSILD